MQQEKLNCFCTQCFYLHIFYSLPVIIYFFYITDILNQSVLINAIIQLNLWIFEICDCVDESQGAPITICVKGKSEVKNLRYFIY